jgi:general secretion pathway protein L
MRLRKPACIALTPMIFPRLTYPLLSRDASATVPAATWVAFAPADEARGEWRIFRLAAHGAAEAAVEAHGPLEVVARRVPPGATLAVVVPLSRCIVLAVDLPPLQGVKLQQALAGELGERMIGNGAAQHYAAAPVDGGRIREAAACDARWLRLRLDELTAAGLRIAQVMPEASLLPRNAAWWGQLQAGQEPAWLVRAANGEAVRVAPPLLSTLLPPMRDGQDTAWQCFADPACGTPPPAPFAACTALGAAALARQAATAAQRWDLRQAAFAPPDAASRFMAWCASLIGQRSGRFALGAVLALLLVNLLGLNLYALKQQRAIGERQREMERIVTQALPNAPRVLEPALQLEAAWRRTRAGTGSELPGAATLLALFAHTGNAQGLTALDVSASALRATFGDAAALDRAWAACQRPALREPLQRAGVRCTREGTRLVLDFAREAAAATAAPLAGGRPC